MNSTKYPELSRFVSATIGACCLLAAFSADALVNVYSGDNGSLAVGALLQLQFTDEQPSGGNSTQDFIIRRLQLEFEASFEKDWLTRIQFDFGSNSNHPSVLDAYIRYTGFDAGNLTFGNLYAPFSRERLISAKALELPERTFVGNINYGVPGRQPGIVFAGSSGPFDYSLGWFHAGIQPSTSAINFSSPVNSNGQYTGNLYAGRLQFTPWGQSVPYTQGYLDVNPGLTFGANVYRWSNDDSAQSSTPGTDWSTVNGYGLDAAYRGGGFSVDAGYNWFDGNSRDPTVTA
jgi:phosphate-selective porin OprO and OprP